MARRTCLLIYCLALSGLAFSSGCCCMPCLRMPCIQELDRHYPGSNDCLNGGPCGDPEDVGGRPTGMAHCETCAPQRQLNHCSSCNGGWFPWTRGFTGGGCGRFYWDEWWSDPPCKCEPCDLQGNYCGTGICRSWRLGLPMPMLSRNCCTANAAYCGGSSLSYWANNRRTCWSGCLNPCRTACSSGMCHIDSVGYDPSCDHCSSSPGRLVPPPHSPTPATEPTPAQPAPEAAPVERVTKRPVQMGAQAARTAQANGTQAARTYAAPTAKRTQTAARPVSAPTSMNAAQRR